jgi:phosphoribosylaminoimidazolecarboxamide formyltransferase/IMP cyclohydrolase
LKKYALISLTDKTGVKQLASGLSNAGYSIVSTGNTAKVIASAGIECVEVSDFTGFPEILGGRVKTLNPKIFGGILARRDIENDLVQMEEHSISFIDILAVNLYNFSAVARDESSTVDELIEKIDIGGVSLIRAAAKNHKFVSILTSPEQYGEFLERLATENFDQPYRQFLAIEAFKVTAGYDTMISSTLEKKIIGENSCLTIFEPERRVLRYGENPHQKGYFFGDFSENFEQLIGKELSYNNILDLSAATDLVGEFEGIGCAIIKHSNPCGAAINSSVLGAYLSALSCDPVSAFGGIVVFNSEVDSATAEKLNEIFLELVVAPSFSEEALEILSKKKQRRVLLQKRKLESPFIIRNAAGGYLVQDRDSFVGELDLPKCVTKANYAIEKLDSIKFAWTVCKNVKSNAIVLVKDGKTIGIGAGQVSRIDSVKIAIRKAGEFGFETRDAIAASDAFFPFEDGVNLLAEAGITEIIQPGGSVRDQESIEAADKHGISMIFTKVRHFKH